VQERFQIFFSDLTSTTERIGTSQGDKEKARKIFVDMERTSRELVEKINRIRMEIETAA